MKQIFNSKIHKIYTTENKNEADIFHYVTTGLKNVGNNFVMETGFLFLSFHYFKIYSLFLFISLSITYKLLHYNSNIHS